MRPTAAQTAGAAQLPGLLHLAGSVHPPGQAEAVLGGWFRIGPLSALRKLTLLRLACGVPLMYQSVHHLRHNGWRWPACEIRPICAGVASTSMRDGGPSDLGVL